jgi:hypothetical protein
MKAQLLTSSFLLEAEHIAPIGYGKRATWIKKMSTMETMEMIFFLFR